MNTLTYISRQFDVLASTSAADSIRSAPPSPAPNRHRRMYDENLPSTSSSTSAMQLASHHSLPNIQSRRISSSALTQGRTKAQTFLQGPRRISAASNSKWSGETNVELVHHSLDRDPSEIPLPPSPSSSSPTLPMTSAAAGETSPSGLASTSNSASNQNLLMAYRSPSMPPRKRRRRKTLAFFVLRPFMGIWNLLLSAWFWLLGVQGPAGPMMKRRTRSGSVSLGLNKLKHSTGAERTTSSAADASPARERRSDLPAQALQDPDPSEHGSPARPPLPSTKSIGDEDDPISFATSASILLASPPTSILQSSSSSSMGQSSASTGSDPRIRISLPATSASGSNTDGSGSHAAKGKLTPWPSEERIRMLNNSAPRVDDDEEMVDDSEEEEAEVDQVLMRRRPRRKSSKNVPVSSSELEVAHDSLAPPLTEQDLNLTPPPLLQKRSSGSLKGKGKQQQSESSGPGSFSLSSSSSATTLSPPLPQTIITPPSTVDLTLPTSPSASVDDQSPPDADDEPTSAPSPSLLPRPSSQLLLPNRLGTSYLTNSRSRRGNNSRRNSAEYRHQLSQSQQISQQSYQQQQDGTGAGRAKMPAPSPFHRPKTLVLDLDETLIHSTSSRTPLSPSAGGGSGGGIFNELGGLFIGGGSGGGFGGMGLFSSGLLAGAGGLLGSGKGSDRTRAGHMIEVVLNGRSTLYTVYKRPFVDYFLRKVSGWYTLVVFTASMQEYADPVIDWLDGGRGIISQRYFRESCTQLPNGTYAKDLSQVDSDLSRVCLLDNSPVSYSLDQANGIPIEGWYSDPSDEALLDLLPVLDSLRFTSDVRRVLGIKAF